MDGETIRDYSAMMVEAVENLHSAGTGPLTALALIAVAREMRESAPGLLTVKAVELKHCHCATFVVRIGDVGRWWHPGSKTWCADESPTEIPSTPPVRAAKADHVDQTGDDPPRRIVGDLADDQRDNAAAAYEADE